MSKKGIEEREIVPNILYPLQIKLDWIYAMVDISADSGILFGYIKDDYDGDNKFFVEPTHTIAGKRYMEEKLPLTILSSDIKWSDETDKELAIQNGIPHYLRYDFREKKWYGGIEVEEYYRVISRIEQMQFGCLKYQISNVILKSQLDKIMELMKLQQRVLMLSGKIFLDFESMVVYRLIHNMLWSGITETNWEDYYQIFHSHQILSFENIRSDERFQIKEIGTLYVPKDNAEQDAVLYRVSERYLDEETANRHKEKYLFNRIIEKNEDGEYMVAGHKIQKIVFLFDNFEYGSSTINTLALYLGREAEELKAWTKDKIDKHRKSLQTYICGNEVVNVTEICEVNKIKDVEVYSYFGTEEGKKKIEDLLTKIGFDKKAVSYKEIIYQRAACVKSQWEKIWKSKGTRESRTWVGDDVFLVVREFNLTKRNVFPDEMITNPKKAISMFVKKPE